MPLVVRRLRVRSGGITSAVLARTVPAASKTTCGSNLAQLVIGGGGRMQGARRVGERAEGGCASVARAAASQQTRSDAVTSYRLPWKAGKLGQVGRAFASLTARLPACFGFGDPLFRSPQPEPPPALIWKSLAIHGATIFSSFPAFSASATCGLMGPGFGVSSRRGSTLFGPSRRPPSLPERAIRKRLLR